MRVSISMWVSVCVGTTVFGYQCVKVSVCVGISVCVSISVCVGINVLSIIVCGYQCVCE